MRGQRRRGATIKIMSATRTKSTYDVNGLKFRKASFEEETMTVKHLFVLGASILASTLAGGAVAQQADERYVQMAEIEVDPVQLDAYRAAVQEQIDAAIRKEPGVLVLYAVSEKDRRARASRHMEDTILGAAVGSQSTEIRRRDVSFSFAGTRSNK